MTQPGDQQNQSQQSTNDLGSELRELGQQLEQAVRSALESDRAKQVQADISSGMKEIGAQLQHAVRALQDNPNVQNLVQRGEQAVGQAQQSRFAQDLQESMARGIAALNEQLSAFVSRVNQDSANAAGTSPDVGTGSPYMGAEPGTTGTTGTSGTTSGTTSAGSWDNDPDLDASTGPTTRLDPDKQ